MKVVVVLPRDRLPFINEELSLVKTIYSQIVETVVVKKANPRTYLSEEKLEKISGLDFDKLVVMDQLRPVQLINLLRFLKRDVIDRMMLILEIFAEHAGSKEAVLQIELARLRYYLPLVKEAIRYAKLGELHGFLGAGRYGYEKYYLMLRRREARVRRELERLAETRSIRRKARREKGFYHVAIAGYTCAGKTTLFNALTGLSKPVGPEPFTTLSPKSAKIVFKGLDIILTDTVGFIRDLPPEIVDAFYATLEEISYSDMVIDVVDSSKPREEIINEVSTSLEVFSRLGVVGPNIIIALNKIDLTKDVNESMEAVREVVGEKYPVVPISALRKYGISNLLEKVAEMLSSASRERGVRT